MSGQEQVRYFRDHQVSTSEQLRVIAARVKARRASVEFNIERKPYP